MSSDRVHDHYRQVGLTNRICEELQSAGHDIDALEATALSGVDEFHLGGRQATLAIIDTLPLTKDSHVLDVGCGIGGAARTMSEQTGCSVLGIDVTAEFIETADDLSTLVGLHDRTMFRIGNALELPMPDHNFDVATLLHVGMNISDKAALFAELSRLLRPGGTLMVYDIMRVGDGELTYPLPWSSDPSTSFVARPGEYVDALMNAGLTVDEPIDRLGLVRQSLADAAENPPSVDLSHLMGMNWPTMFANLRTALGEATVSPTQIRATKAN